jgi:hypothetical protein
MALSTSIGDVYILDEYSFTSVLVADNRRRAINNTISVVALTNLLSRILVRTIINCVIVMVDDFGAIDLIRVRFIVFNQTLVDPFISDVGDILNVHVCVYRLLVVRQFVRVHRVGSSRQSVSTCCWRRRKSVGKKKRFYQKILVPKM